MKSNTHLGLYSVRKHAPKLVQVFRSLRVVSPLLQRFHELFGVHCLGNAACSLFRQNEPFSCPEICFHLPTVVEGKGRGSIVSRRCRARCDHVVQWTIST